MLNRRDFIGLTSVFSAAIFFLFNLFRQVKYLPNNHALSEQQTETLKHVHEHLFPKETNRPGAIDIRSTEYFKSILFDPQVKVYKKRLLQRGINWTEETSQELFQKSFTHLEFSEKEKVLVDLKSYKNGQRWLSVNISLILEALLADPIYNVNTNQIGWNWLKHIPGYPRPDYNTKYQYL